MPVTAKVGLGWSQESGTPLRSPAWVQTPKHFGHPDSVPALSGAFAGSWIGSRTTGDSGAHMRCQDKYPLSQWFLCTPLPLLFIAYLFPSPCRGIEALQPGKLEELLPSCHLAQDREGLRLELQSVSGLLALQVSSWFPIEGCIILSWILSITPFSTCIN